MFHSENTCKHVPVVYSVAVLSYVYYNINMICGTFMEIYPTPSVKQNLFHSDWATFHKHFQKYLFFSMKISQFRLIFYRSLFLRAQLTTV